MDPNAAVAEIEAGGGGAGGEGLPAQAGAGGEAGGQPAEPTLQQVMQQLTGLQREVGGYRRLNGFVDKFPTMLDEKLKNYFTEQRNQNLPPEQLKELQNKQAQEKALEEFIQTKALERVKSEFGPQLGILERADSLFKQQDYYSNLSELAGEDLDTLTPVMTNLYTEKAKQLESGNPAEVQAAIKWIERADKEPAFLVYHATREASKLQQSQEQQLLGGRQQAGKEAGRSVRAGGASQSGRKPMHQMNQAELDAHAEKVGLEQFKKELAEDRARYGGK